MKNQSSIQSINQSFIQSTNQTFVQYFIKKNKLIIVLGIAISIIINIFIGFNNFSLIQNVYAENNINNINNINNANIEDVKKNQETQDVELQTFALNQQKLILETRWQTQKNICLKKFWVERCLNQIKDNYYQQNDALEQQIIDFEQQTRTQQQQTKQQRILKNQQQALIESQGEDPQIKTNQALFLEKQKRLQQNEGLDVNLQSQSRENLELNMPLDLLSSRVQALPVVDANNISQQIRGSILNAPIVKPPPLPKLTAPEIAQNSQTFQDKQNQKPIRAQNLQERIKSLDDFVKKYQTK